jgi:8-oxo-dGTP pyrophosphatase MutT (NUDIX family)
VTEETRSGDAGTGGTSGSKRRRRRRGSSKAGARVGDGSTGTSSGTSAAATAGSARGSASSGRGRGGSRRRRRSAATGSGGRTADAKAAARGGANRGAKASQGTGKKRAGAKRSGAKGGGAKRGGRRRGPPVPTKREISSGGVVYRRDGEEIEVVLASRRTRRGQLAWGLAKGGIEDGESMEDAATREVREETGLVAVIEASLGETRYFYVWEDVRIRKTVHFFLMRHTGGDVDDRDDEMEEVRWFPLERALKRAAYRGERDVLQRASELLR